MPPNQQPILITGPTASGKSGLALRLAQMSGSCIINADALQVYTCWHVLSARPGASELAQAPHHLYGHVAKHTRYSAGHWLNDVRRQLECSAAQGKRAIIIGGTGLYFMALTQGLAEIPPIPDDIRARANNLRKAHGKDIFLADMQAHDPNTLAILDQNNDARLQRAWEVLRATGRGLSAWQAETGPPLVRPGAAVKIHLNADRDWLAERIERRFDAMIGAGALGEVENYISDGWEPDLPSAKAIGAKELVQYLDGRIELQTAIERAKAQTRQYAKRQRTWFRSRMKDWQQLDPAKLSLDTELNKIITGNF